MSKLNSNFWLWGGLLPAVIVGFDQLTKYLAVKAFDVPMNICAIEDHPYAHIEISPVFDLSLVCNRGVSFGMFSGHPEIARVVFTAFAAIMCVVLLVWMSRETSKLTRCSLGLIIGGAIGNAIDRALFGAVTDFLNFGDIGFVWVFNIADSAISCGVAGLILSMLLQGRAEKRAKQAADAKPKD